MTSIVSEYEFEEQSEEVDPSTFEHDRHHEDTVAFQKRFSNDVDGLEKALISNPFKLEKLTALNNHEKASFNDCVFEDLKIIGSEGENQFLEFWEKRLLSNTLSIKNTICLNSYNLPGNYNKKAANDPVITAIMVAKLVNAGIKRRYLVEDALNT